MNKGLSWLAVAIALVGGFEGLRQNAYRDVVQVPTICYGETLGVKMGDKKTLEECDTMLAKRLIEFNKGVESCVRQPLTDSRRIAFISLSYNIGISAFCKSTVVRKINAGDVLGACDAILMWKFAKGVEWPGLVRRRQAERQMCLAES